MLFKITEKPREYKVGVSKDIIIKDLGQIRLQSDEQLTFFSETGSEYDFTKKNWGYYGTPSLNGRLKSFGLRACLVKNRENLFYILVIESEKENLFNDYCEKENLSIVTWLDTDEALENIENKLKL